MIFTPTKLPGVFVVELQKVEDSRGFFARAWCSREFQDHNLSGFVQANMSLSKKRGTIRGLHYQLPPHAEAKFIRCIGGAVFDVVVDIRPNSPTYMQWLGVELSTQNRQSLFIPEGLPHAYQALTDDAEIIYTSSSFYTPSAERGIRWNDPAFNIQWPVKDVIVSDKDAHWPDYLSPIPRQSAA